MSYQEQKEIIEFLEHIKDENAVIEIILTYVEPNGRKVLHE